MAVPAGKCRVRTFKTIIGAFPLLCSVVLLERQTDEKHQVLFRQLGTKVYKNVFNDALLRKMVYTKMFLSKRKP
jgi:hypothetical protein